MGLVVVENWEKIPKIFPDIFSMGETAWMILTLYFGCWEKIPKIIPDLFSVDKPGLEMPGNDPKNHPGFFFQGMESPG